MIIPTLTSESYLYKVHRNKQEMLTKLEKRKAFFYCCAITLLVGIATTLWIVYR